MSPDNSVYEGCLRVCDQSMNLVLQPAIEKINVNGIIKQKSVDILFLRGDEVSFISPNMQAKLHRSSETKIE